MAQIYNVAAFWGCPPSLVWSLTARQYVEWVAHADRIAAERAGPGK